MDTGLLEHIENELTGGWTDAAGTPDGISHVVINNEEYGSGWGNNCYC